MRPEPNATCPEIDRDIKAVEELADDVIRAVESELSHVTNAARGALESMRTANADIREWAYEWKDHAEAMETERDDLQAEVDRLESLVDALRDEIEKLNGV